MGVSRVEQLHDNIAALDLVLAPEHRAALDAVSAPADPGLYALFGRAMRARVVFDGASVTGWREA